MLFPTTNFSENDREIKEPGSELLAQFEFLM